MTLCVAGGNVVKSTLQSWTIMTEQLLLTVKGGQRIVVIKDTYDEYFDPILFYARRPITILSATEGIQRCDPNTVYVTKRSWLLNNAELIPGDARILTTLQHLQRAFEGSQGEDIEVFTCARRVHNERTTSEGLKDAVFESGQGYFPSLNTSRRETIWWSPACVAVRVTLA